MTPLLTQYIYNDSTEQLQCCSIHLWRIVNSIILYDITFFQRLLIGGLSVRKYGFHVNAHRTFWRVRAAYDAEAQALVARAFVELDRHYRETRILAATPRQSVETIAVVFSALWTRYTLLMTSTYNILLYNCLACYYYYYTIILSFSNNHIALY